MRINEIIGEWVAMPHTAKSMGLRKANSHWMPINVGNNKANEDEKTSSAQWSSWRKKNPIGRNWMNPDDYDSDAPGTHIIAYTPTEQHMYKIPAKNYDEAFDKWLNDRDSNNPKDSQYYDSTKDYASEQDYWGRIAPENDPMNWPDAQKEEDAMGVGTITKQNTTKDVKPGEIQRQLKKLHLR
jgi:hypothetical protein